MEKEPANTDRLLPDESSLLAHREASSAVTQPHSAEPCNDTQVSVHDDGYPNPDVAQQEAELTCWRDQISLRGCMLGTVLGFAMSIITLKLSLSTGVIPSLNIAAGMLGYVGMNSYCRCVTRCAGIAMNLTKQEITVVQTYTVAMSGCAFIIGFGSYYLAMDERSWEATGSDPSTRSEIVRPSYGNVIPYAFCVCFTGIFLLVYLRNTFILDPRFVFPSGSATATMINSFFTESGQALAKQQFQVFCKWFGLGFVWDLWAWFYSGGPGQAECGFTSFPFFGLKAYEWTWTFNFEFNYIAVGLLSPHIVNYSMLMGSILSWGFMWPYIKDKAGDWYSDDADGLRGLLGYQVFLSIALIVGDGLYNVGKMLLVGVRSLGQSKQDERSKAKREEEGPGEDEDFERRKRLFLDGKIPWPLNFFGYLACAALGTFIIPRIFHGCTWYVILAAYLVCPLFAIPNAYMCGLTDWDMSSTFGKLILFLFATWCSSVDKSTGIIAGLATCGIVKAGTSQAATLMQDFKTGFITESSPVAMFYAQILGTIAGCLLSPVAFFIYYDAFDIGNPTGEYPAPYAKVYRGMAIIGTEGFDSLPHHCLQYSAYFFALSILLSLVRDVTPLLGKPRVTWLVENFVPIPMAMAVPFYIGADLAIDMCIGSIIKFIWARRDSQSFSNFHTSVASGIIAGDGIWSLPSAFLALGGVRPPLCMQFIKAA
ncbi:hypothetical protein CYMTET_15600 [Cymbomonas tetramitiformis]|uniref:Uncharacterized protein n=1 Tax=Cymbomonas tetramitiformis TaxID=36881 RepID=A0AAE0GDR6_9CHLO|nr:hypothetical protein CYMTET_15600 [Cymbomonas tetramitiformis]